MSVALGWLALLLIAYCLVAQFAALFMVRSAIASMASSWAAGLDAERPPVVNWGYGTGLKWLKQNLAMLPDKAQANARAARWFDQSAKAAIMIAVLIYGYQLITY